MYVSMNDEKSNVMNVISIIIHLFLSGLMNNSVNHIKMYIITEPVSGSMKTKNDGIKVKANVISISFSSSFIFFLFLKWYFSITELSISIKGIFINSDGWKVIGPRVSQHFEPFTSFPINKVIVSRKIDTMYIIVEYFNIFSFPIIIKKVIKIKPIIIEIICFKYKLLYEEPASMEAL